MLHTKHKNPPRLPIPKDVDSGIKQLVYSAKLTPALQNIFVPLNADTVTYKFMENAFSKYGKCNVNSWAILMARRALGYFMSHTNAIGILGCGLMHIISANQMETVLRASFLNPPVDANTMLTSKFKMRPSLSNFFSTYNPDITTMNETSTLVLKGEKYGAVDNMMNNMEKTKNTKENEKTDILLVEDGDNDTESEGLLRDREVSPIFEKKYGDLLDVGAGSGRMAELLKPLFDEIECTEVSQSMVDRIRGEGMTCYHTGDITTIPENKKYDCITLFNLIDRCNEPMTLLNNVKDRLRDADSRLVIAVPLPLKPAVEKSNGYWAKPDEHIAPSGCHCQYSWEESVEWLVRILSPNFHVRAISRLPYLSEGDFYRYFYQLDDVILVLSKKE